MRKELVLLVSKSPNTIAHICRNESQPTLASPYEIADALKVSIRDLLVLSKYANE